MPSPQEVAFQTSGHTGRPVAWLRTQAQMRRELEIVLGDSAARLQRIVSFATDKHLYGHLYAKLLPQLHGIELVEAWRDPLQVPARSAGERTLIVAIPSAWPLLKRMLKAEQDVAGVTLLHSTSMVPSSARPIIAAFAERGARLTELLGSTETGAVGWRDMADRDSPWRLFGDVRLSLQGEDVQPLRVSSPRIARRDDMSACPQVWEIPDLIVPLAQDRFRHVGRNSRFLKVDGLRCDLDVIEDVVRSLNGLHDVACIVRSSPIRGEHYDLYYSASSPRIDEERIRSLLREAPQYIPVPRIVRRVVAIPRTALGKVSFADLAT